MNRCKIIVNRVVGVLNKMIKDGKDSQKIR